MPNYVQVASANQAVSGTNGQSNFTATTTSTDGVSFISYSGISSGFVVGADRPETHTHTMSTQVAGAQLRIGATHEDEPVRFVLDGVTINLSEAIANGTVTFDDGGRGTYIIDAQGNFVGKPGLNGSQPELGDIATITFNVPFTTLQVVSLGSGFNDGTAYELYVDTNPAVAPDGVVDGAETGQNMPIGYADAQNDVIDGNDGVNDSIRGNGGNDTIEAGQGSDTVSGGAGNDLIYGDNVSGTNSTVSLPPNYVEVTSANQFVTGTNGQSSFGVTTTSNDGVGFISWSSISNGFWIGNNGVETHTHSMTTEVAGAQLRLSATHQDEPIRFFLDGVELNLSEAIASGMVTFNDGGRGSYIIDGEGRFVGRPGFNGLQPELNDVATLTINVPFTTLRLVSEGSGFNAGTTYELFVNTNPTTFVGGADSLAGDGGSDTLFGGVGDDTLNGNDGNDSLVGGADNDRATVGAGDTVSGGDGADTIVVDRTQLDNNGQTVANMTADGNAGGTDNDTLDLRNAGNWRIINQTPDSNGNGTNGTVQFLDASGNATGQVLNFTEIETILGTPFTPANQPPVFSNVTDGQTINVAENTTFVVDANATDPNNDPLTFSIVGGEDQARFTIDPATGVLSFTSAPDFEGQNSVSGDDIYQVTIRVADGRGGQQDVTLNVNVTDVNETPANQPPVFTNVTNGQVIAVDENTTFVVNADATDPNNDPLTFSIVGGEDAGRFTIDPATGVLSFTSAPDFEGQNSVSGDDIYQVTIRVSDGRGGQQDVTLNVNVTDVNEGPVRDGIVNGTAGNDNMPIGFEDAQRDQIDGADGLNDRIEAGAGDDTIDAGLGNDTLDAGDGNDSATGGAGDDSLLGGAGSDTLSGGVGADTITGGAGDDDIAVGGSDSATGGSGDDVFVIDGTDTAANVNVTIDGGTDGTVGAGDDAANGNAGDVLDLSAGTASLTVNFATNPENGTVNGLDADAGTDLSFAEIERLSTGSGNDTIIGGGSNGPIVIDTGSGNDSITTGSGNDSIIGGAGDDTISSGTGNDSVTGGGGNDSVNGGEGDDTLQGNDGNDTLAGGGGNDNLDGGANDDSLSGGDGADTIIGGDGADTLDGGAQNDLMEGGSGDDDLTGGDGDDTLAGDGGADTLAGGQGNDSLSGGSGNDSLTGAEGNDTLSGGEGSDTLQGGNGNDSLIGGDGDDDIVVGAGDTAQGGAGDDEFTVDPTHTGNAPIVVIGGETLEEAVIDPTNNPGGRIGDVLDLIGLTDVQVTYTNPDPISGTSESGTVTYRNASGQLVTLTFSEIETVLTAADGVVDGTGAGDLMTPTSGPGGTPFRDPQGDQIDGTDGLNDVVVSGAGNDTVDAGLGNDSVDGGIGNDSIAGGSGNDTLIGGTGDDTLDGGAGDDMLTGGQSDDSLIGGADNDTLMGNDGRDTLQGGTGDDSLVGGAEADSLAGNDGRDSLVGDAGNDTLDGGAAADSLIGGEGDDSILGGEGDDTIDAGIGNDRVTGDAGRDQIAAGEGNDTVDGGADADTITGGDGLDSLSGSGGDDSLAGDAGNDTLDGGDGNDTLSGGAGSDLLSGGAGNDSVAGGAGDDDLVIGAGDRAEGGDGDDEFRVNPALAGTAPITVIGGELGENMDDPTNGGAGDVLDLRGLTNVVINVTGAESGVATYQNGAGQTVTITYSEIERVLVDTNGVVDGTAAGDLMTPTSGPGGSPFTDAQGDQVDGTDGVNDTIASGQGADTVDGGQGNDTIDGGAGDDSLSGNIGNDSLLGGEGGDTLAGDDGADTLDGGEGNDSLSGGDGNDSLIGADGADTLQGGIGDDRLDAGNGADSLAGGTGADTLLGGAGADTLQGGAGADSVSGGAGDDDIIVGGADTATGGTGDDVFTADASDSDVNAQIDGGQDATSGNPDDAANGDAGDSLDLSAQTANITLVFNQADAETGTANGLDADAQTDIAFAEIERFATGSGNDTISGAGTSGAIIVATNAGNDSIATGAGNDVIDAGSGNDIIASNSGDDSVSAGSGDDVVNAGAGNDTVDGGANNDDLTGGSGNDRLIGGDGNDTLDGGAENDTLTGGTGDDRLIGGNGEDSLTGDEGRDTLQGGIGNDSLFGGDEADSLQGGSGNDRLFGGDGADIAEGNEGDDIIEGGDGADTLFGNEGNDTLNGGEGNDSIVGGEGRDSVTGGLGDDVINTRNTQALPDEAGALSDPDPNDDRDTVFGGDGNDTILTGDDADLVFGDIGNDSIDAGLDDDTVSGGEGDDTILGDEGDDSIDGGDGNDLLYGGSNVATPADLPNNGSDPLVSNNEDTVRGGDGNDTIFGFDDNDSLTGDGGNDVIFGGLDDDRIDGGAGNDSLSGDEGNDSLTGGEGNDTLNGGAGRDTLVGGIGADLLVGGAGADVFSVQGADTITDFDATTGIQGTTGAPTTDNDFVDLSAFYNDATLATFLQNNPGASFQNPLAWLRADQADGVLQGAGNLRLQNGGTAVDGALLNLENTAVVCFTRGTRILTAEGERAIEDLAAGDLVFTLDHGYQPIRWIGSSTVAGKGRFAPIVIEAGALGNTRRLAVSPQHRMLLSGWQAELLFDEPEVLVAAKLLVNDSTIRAEERDEVEYFHMLFDAHEVVIAEGAPSESFHPGHVGWGALAEAAREEILALFPQLDGMDFTAYGPSARRSLTSAEARVARDALLGDGQIRAAE